MIHLQVKTQIEETPVVSNSKVHNISYQDGQCFGGSQQSINTMKAYINELIPRQYFFDMNYFQLLSSL